MSHIYSVLHITAVNILTLLNALMYLLHSLIFLFLCLFIYVCDNLNLMVFSAYSNMREIALAKFAHPEELDNVYEWSKCQSFTL